MMAVHWVLLASVLLQGVAVLLALRLIPVTGNLKAWICISAAIALMAVRRFVTLLHGAAYGWEPWEGADLTTEIVALVTSFLLVVGIAYIAPLFRCVQDAKEALAAETERLTVTLRSIGDGVITTDTRGRVALVNRAAEEMTGWGQEEAAGRAFGEVFRAVDQETGEALRDPVGRILSTGRAEELQENTVLVHRQGARRLVADSGAPILSRRGERIGAVLVFRDVTAQRRMERDLVRAQKMESLGVLAGGIAHDFNNALTAILGNMGLAKLYTVPGGKAHAKIEAAERATRCAEELARQLLTFAKGGEPVKRATRVRPLVQTASLVGLSGSNVRCEMDLPEDTWAVEADAGQIQQALSNLIINAAEAMPGGGAVSVAARNVAVEQDGGPAPGPGRYVVLTVTDQGPGIPAEDLARVFDPFFSTKKQGCGLGLAMVYSIAQRHGGRVDVHSEPGTGAAFSLWLPATEADAFEPEAAADAPPPGGTGRILVMDDEAAVRGAAGDMLAHLGYQVAFAAEGAEALRLYGEALRQGRPFDLVIMDLTIPGGMGGLEAMARLRELDPGVRAVVSSGYSDDPVMARFSAYGFAGVLPKPYRLASLADTVRAVMGRAAA